jgi:hypothetical protein
MSWTPAIREPQIASPREALARLIAAIEKDDLNVNRDAYLCAKEALGKSE